MGKLTIHEKIHIKAIAMSWHGKRVHYPRPDYLDKVLNEHQVIYIVSVPFINKREVTNG